VKTDSLGDRLRHLDLYNLLGVAPSASTDDIRRAYRRQALACHPDVRPGDTEAHRRFLLLTQARDILLDPPARESYDRMRERHGMPTSEQRLAERARRGRSPAELTALWNAGSVVVRAAILRNVFCPLVLFSDPHVEMHWMLSLEAASRLQCPPAVLVKLAESFERCVALAVAMHPATPEAGLCTIVTHHRDMAILNAVAAHPNAGPAVLREVGRAVRGPRAASLGSALLANPACPADVAQRIRDRLGNRVA
jgi:hypothetical protein